MRRRSLSLALTLALTALPLTADAHWPATRGGPTRAGAVVGQGTFTPNVSTRWKRYLGGTAAPGTFVTNAKGDVVYLARAEHLRATKPNDSGVWESPLVGVREVVGVADLNGDKKDEVIAVSAYSGRVLVFDALSGAVVWATDPERFRAWGVGAVRLRDVTGDGLPDLYVASRGSGALTPGSYADVYGFAGGFASAATLLTVDLSQHDYDYGENDAWADLDGDGAEEIVLLGNTHAYAYALGGAPLASGDVGKIPYGKAKTIVADVDGDGDDEVVLLSNAGYPALQNARRVAVLDLAPDGSTLTVRWEHGADDLANDRHYFTGEAVSDLDGDGALELVGGFYHASLDENLTHVWSAATGAELGAIPGVVQGVADVDGDGSPEILVSPGEDGWGLSAYRFANGQPELVWTLLDRRLPKDLDPATRGRQSAIDRTVLFDVDPADGRRELVLVRRHADGTESLDAYDTSSGSPVLEASYALELGVSVGAVQLLPSSTGDQLFVSRTDGYLALLEGALVPTNQVVYPSSAKVPGLRTSGYFTGYRGVTGALLSGALLGNGKDQLVVRDSRGALLALDPGAASLSQPPAVLWEQLGETSEPALVDVDGDGTLEVVTGRRDVIALRSGADGQVLWEKGSLDADAAWFVGADVDGDGAQEIAVATRSLDDALMRYFFLDAAGAQAWSPVEISGNLATGLPSVGDVTGDGVADVVAHPGNNLIAIDGATGQVFYQAPAGQLSMLPLLQDLDADGVYEHVYTNGHSSNPVGFLASASGLTVESVTPAVPGEFGFYQYGTVVSCPSGLRQIFANQNSPRVQVIDPSAGAVLFEAFLAAGSLHASADDALAATTAPPYVGNVTAVSDLAGDGQPRLLAPSTDGNLYVLRACADDVSTFLDFATDFGVPVSEAVPADVDADASLEILVTTLDGELRCLDVDWLAAPLAVEEGQGAEAEIDDVETFGSIPVRWSAVPGAVGYEVGIFDPSGAPVVPFHPVSKTASIEVGDFALDAAYRTYVRALGANGEVSFEHESDGFRRVDVSPPVVTFGPLGTIATALAEDLTGLELVAIELVSPSGEIVRQDEQVVAGTSAGISVSLEGLAAGTYTLHARAEDVAGHEGAVALEVKLGDSPVDPPVIDPSGAGCACSTVPSPAHAGAGVSALLALLPLLRRRSRRPPARG